MSRTKILKTITLVAFAIIAVRLFFIQIIEHDKWVAKASDQHTLLETIVAKRGEIYMMNGSEPVQVVLNETVFSVIIDPAVTDKDRIITALNEHAKDQITADLDKVFSTEGLRYYIVAKNVSHSAATKIADQDIPGVWFQTNNQRAYPEGEFASGLLGFVNADGLGQYGVEGSLNKLLSGTNGLLKTTSDINNVALSIGDDNVKIPAEDGKDVVLSIDRGLEEKVEELAKATIANTAATNASVLVLKADTNEVLAMANLPNYNPGDYGNVKDESAYINYTTQNPYDPYEPASVCKSFAFSAAINEGVMTPETTYFNDHYDIVDERKIENAWKGSNVYGQINMKDALNWSLNTGSMQALRLLGGDAENINREGREKLYDYYYNRFRLGQKTGIELIEDAGSLIEPNANMYGLNAAYANMTFGQNLNVTMIQTITAFSAVVNGGFYRTPTILKGTIEDGKIVESNQEDRVEEQVLSSETSATMRDLLINNRSSKRSQGIDRKGYSVGGKSGTAQMIIGGAYDTTMEKTVGSYAGFVASEGGMPEYVIMVKLWNPKGAKLEGKDAGYLFDSISNFVIDYFKIKPGGV
ncbi:MAG: penicillin-binding protein 2 [Candidatus Saccharibacteria bacterium]|nr:penicillin-binding protein 2 [Candidatus Saccharibacteria bacterium]